MCVISGGRMVSFDLWGGGVWGGGVGVGIQGESDLHVHGTCVGSCEEKREREGTRERACGSVSDRY